MGINIGDHHHRPAPCDLAEGPVVGADAVGEAGRQKGRPHPLAQLQLALQRGGRREREGEWETEDKKKGDQKRAPEKLTCGCGGEVVVELRACAVGRLLLLLLSWCWWTLRFW